MLRAKKGEKVEREYFSKGDSGFIPQRYIKEHDKGHRPVENVQGEMPVPRIEMELLNEHGINESMAFFTWFLLNRCEPCGCELCGCDRGECECLPNVPAIDNIAAEVHFYDIAACCEKLKEADMKALKKEYKQKLSDKKATKNKSDNYYYAKIGYYSKGGTEKRKSQYTEDYAIIYRDWAHLNPSPPEQKKQINAKSHGELIMEYVKKYPMDTATHMADSTIQYSPQILEKYERRPKGLSEEKANRILSKLKKANPNMKLKIE